MSNEEMVIEYQITNDKKILENILDKNKRLIYKLVKTYRNGRHYDIEDLIQAGNLGMIKAVKSYDPQKGYAAAFSTYAVYWINRYICNTVFGSYDKEKENIKINNAASSLNKKFDNDSDDEVGDIIPSIDEAYDSIEVKIIMKSLRNELNEQLETLTLKQREIMKMMYGWNGKQASVTDISEIFNLSRSYIYDIEYKSLMKLKKSSWGSTKGIEYCIALTGKNPKDKENKLWLR